MNKNTYKSQQPCFINKLKRACIAVFIIILLFCIPASASLTVDVVDDKFSKSHDEGSKVEYNISIYGIPVQAKVLELNTDLIAGSEKMLWTFNTSEIDFEGSLNSSLIKLKTTDVFPNAITISISGRTPSISEETVTNGIVITKRPVQRSGFVYYNIRSFDANGNIVGTAATQTFEITIPDEKEFFARANALDNANIRDLVMNMYKDGLTNEAWESLKAYEKIPKPIPTFIPIVIGGIGGFFLYRFMDGGKIKPSHDKKENS